MPKTHGFDPVVKRFIHPLLLLVARATEKEGLVQMVEYLKAENRLLRAKLPKGTGLRSPRQSGPGLSSWACASAGDLAADHRRPSRDLRPLGKRKQVGQACPQAGSAAEARRDPAIDPRYGQRHQLGVWANPGGTQEAPDSRLQSTVARILRENGFEPGPKRGRGTWHEFIQRHVETVWATDFFTKKVWTIRSPVTFYVLFFLHVHTRRVHISAGMTPNPDGRWMTQIARNMSMVFAENHKIPPHTHHPRSRFQVQRVLGSSTPRTGIRAYPPAKSEHESVRQNVGPKDQTRNATPPDKVTVIFLQMATGGVVSITVTIALHVS